MQRFAQKLRPAAFFLTGLFLSGPVMGGTALAGAADPGYVARPLTLKLGPPQHQTSSRAELLLPTGSQKAPLVLLIQGTGPEDMDGSFVSNGQTVAGSLGALARALAAQGFAVMRFDKRYAAATFDPHSAAQAQQQYDQLSLRDLLSDARTALQSARQQPEVDTQRTFVYGWSEGSVLAAALAQEVGARGLVVQGPVVAGFAASFAHQFETVGLTYLKPYAPDGNIDLAGVLAALRGPGSGLAKMQASLLLGRNSTPTHPTLATVLDTNHDGKLNLQTEVLPRVGGFYANFAAQSPLYAPAGTLPTLGELAPRLKMPVLILQGQNDGNIDPAYARQLDGALQQAGNHDHTLKLYPGLGHTLGKADSITSDHFAPMQRLPMNDMAAWLRAHSR